MSSAGKIRQRRKVIDELRKRRSSEADESYSNTPPQSPPDSPTSDPAKDALKIKIKLQPQAPTPRVGLLPFDNLIGLRASLSNYVHHTGDWTDGMCAGLKTQLEGAKASIAYLAQEVAQHLQVLEAWKPPSQEGEPSLKRKQSDGEKKGKKRRHEAGENDSSYSTDSSAEEDVDVVGDEAGDVDVEELDGDETQAQEGEEVTREDEYMPKVKSRGGSTNRKMAQMIMQRSQAKGRASRRKFLKNLNGGQTPLPRNRNKNAETPPSTSPVEYDPGVTGKGAELSSEEEEEEAAPLPLGPNVFWTAMDPYLRPLTEHDLAYITPKLSRSDDPIYIIPSLGPHYTQVWATDDGLSSSSPPPRPGMRVKTEGGEYEYSHTNDDEDADPIMGDMTQRILQSLIDENIFMNRPPSPFSDDIVINPEEGKDGMPHQHSIPAVPVASYSREGMVVLEERIRMELRAIGLLDDEEIDPSEREDDEVCAELRLFQSQLREQIASNNDRRVKLIALVKPKMREQEEARKQKAANNAIEKNFAKLIQRKKKRGGRRAPPPQVGAA